jgi:uncharacterized membrane protein YkvA (DUF1232 family)
MARSTGRRSSQQIQTRSVSSTLVGGRDFDKESQSIFALLILSLVIIYIVSPFDAIPEAKYGILGLIDDLVVAVFLFYVVWMMASLTSSIITTMLLIFLIYAQFAPKSK